MTASVTIFFHVVKVHEIICFCVPWKKSEW